MTSKTLSGYYASGYDFNSPITSVTVTASGTVAGSGLASGLTNAYAVYNYGRIAGLYLGHGGSFTNGTAAETDALVRGRGQGVFIRNAIGTVRNFGAILNSGGGTNTGVYLAAGGFVTNLVNYGTLSGAGGQAFLGSAMSTLVVEAGSVFNGVVDGATGALVLGPATGTISGLGAAVTVSGSMTPTLFSNFGSVEVSAGGQFTLAGNPTRSTGHTLRVAGSVSGAGTLSVAGGELDLLSGGALSTAQVAVSGTTSKVNIRAAVATFSGVWSQTAGTLSVAVGDRINFTGAGNSFSGTLAGAGTIGFTGGSDALSAVTLSAASVVINTAAVTLSGAVTISAVVTASTPSLIIAAGGASLTGGGTFSLTNAAANKITGASAGATLTNVNDRITGAGMLGAGKLVLVNQSGGTITGNDPTALIIDTGANVISNAGVISNTGAGGTTIAGAVANAGTLAASGGTLTIKGAVTGAGTVRLNAATVALLSTFTENVTFTGATGVLELHKSQTYTGTITGLSKTGGSQLDLADIVFGSKTKATYSGTATSGTLTVTDGTHTAHIKLAGDYTASTFVVASDGHGGSLVHDPAKTPASASGPAFVASMAGLGAGAASNTFVHAAAVEGRAHVLLAGPRLALA